MRNGMAVVGMPHEFGGLSAEEVTIAEVLSKEGYATAHFGKGHLGDIEESYLHNQGFDEALFTPMNQITSLYNHQGEAANAVLGLHPEIYPPDPYRLDDPGLVPSGWVMTIEGKKGEMGKEFCGTSNDGPMSHSPPPGWAMTEIMYRGGKGDFLEGGVRVPAIAWWPGVIEKGQLVGAPGNQSNW